MTDKEIIIDGVDVSKCRLFKGMNNYHKEQAKCGFYAFCNGTYCDYKKLASKTAECEKLNRKLSIGFQKFCDKDNELQKYKQALDEILELIDREEWAILNYVNKGIKDIINKAKDINVLTKKDGE